MSLRLRFRLLLSALIGALLLVSLATALQFRELAGVTKSVTLPSSELMSTAAEMLQLLGENPRDREFELSFGTLVENAGEIELDEEAAQGVRRVADAFAGRTLDESNGEVALRDAVVALAVNAAERLSRGGEAVRGEASTAAIGLGLLTAITFVLGAWAMRATRAAVFERFDAIDRAVSGVKQGQRLRRLPATGADELSRLGQAVNEVLDLRDRVTAAVEGRNRELRALLVALLHRWPRPAAITGIDGEVMVSTLDERQELVLRSLTAQLRSAATTLLSRNFTTAAELETTILIEGEEVVIQALATGPKRVVGWFSTFSAAAPRHSPHESQLSAPENR